MKKPKRAKKSQHDKFVELAREVGADESEAAFTDKLRQIAKPGGSPMTGRPPLAEKLRLIHANKFATKDELAAALEDAQKDLEELWDTKPPAPIESARCGHPGCNYRRYPAPNARFCLYHSTGNDSLIGRLRRSR